MSICPVLSSPVLDDFLDEALFDEDGLKKSMGIFPGEAVADD